MILFPARSCEADILSVLDAHDLVPLHLVSKHFFKLSRDNGVWRTLVSAKCCSKNCCYSPTQRRKEFFSGAQIPVPDPAVLQLRAAVRSAASSHGNETAIQAEDHKLRGARSGKNREVATQDVNFYHEYIARHSSLAMSWLEKPAEEKRDYGLEIRGLAHFGGLQETIIAPLDDSSVCLWNVGCDSSASSTSNGRIQARSKPGLLLPNGRHPSLDSGEGSHPNMPWNEAIVENVSVDKLRKRVYFAVKGGLNEVDLETLKLLSHQTYPSTICALSEISASAPLTVATAASLHIHDHRLSGHVPTHSIGSDRLDSSPSTLLPPINEGNGSLGGLGTANHAPLIHSPLSIVHLQSSQTIHVAGRFPSILTYDRRTFPKIHSTIHSGARLSSLTSTFSYTTNTLIACGEYNGKGSLELYRLSSSEDSSTLFSSYQNRTTAARSKLLSVATHGTRIVFCDGDGILKWVERNGSTPVRRWNINSSSESETPRGIFARPRDAGPSDVARKILPLNESSNSELAIWTGDKIGVVSCRKKPRFGPWDERGEGEDLRTKESEGLYEERMRRALERQADEVRFMRDLGLNF